MKLFNLILLKTAFIILLNTYFSMNVMAVTGVNPNGVNVRSHGTTTVFITFQGTQGQTSSEAFWCGEITVPANTVTTTNPCVAGTLFGFLPNRLNISRASGTLGASNVTDVMTIPSSVSRRAFQDAQAGNNSSFFYVRKFSGPTGDQFIAVTCRMAGGGARVPLALTNVDLVFKTDDGDKPVTLLAQYSQSPKIGASISYNGSGRLRGRWEVVQPGDIEPTANDLLTEASLPIEQRGLQNRYTVLERFNVFLPPTGRAFIPSPKNNSIPTKVKGPYKILFRVEASFDKEGNSNTTTGITQSGGVAGFPMPVLRYYVASEIDVNDAFAAANTQRGVALISPANNASLAISQPLSFKWKPLLGTKIYRIEIRQNNIEVLSAILKANQTQYQAPPWIFNDVNKPMQWRVVSQSAKGNTIAKSNWRKIITNEK